MFGAKNKRGMESAAPESEFLVKLILILVIAAILITIFIGLKNTMFG